MLDFKDKRVSRAIKRKSKGWLRISNKVASRATIYARVMQVDYIFCGHTHKAMESNRGDVHYYNCGCWTDIPATYITIDRDDMKIQQYL